jgi:xanthine dehydrogenase YagR molybdenum-binding subunit
VRGHADGTIGVQSATVDMGPGTCTSMTQVAADALGVRMDRVRFALGDSNSPPAPLHGGSMAMASVGSAVQSAGKHAAGQVRLDRCARSQFAAERFAPGPDQRLGWAAGNPSRRESYQELLRRRGMSTFDSQMSWEPNDVDEHYTLYAYGAVFAEVAADACWAPCGSAACTPATTPAA